MVVVSERKTFVRVVVFHDESIQLFGLQGEIVRSLSGLSGQAIALLDHTLELSDGGPDRLTVEADVDAGINL
jgi:hypothetical protein